MIQLERRIVPCELRAEEATDGRLTLRGYAAVFNAWSQDLGGFREMLRPGAFSHSLGNGDDVVALFNHNEDHVLGRRSAGTLRCMEDERGLGVEVDVPDTQNGRDVYQLVRRGDLKGMSFAFTLPNPRTDQLWSRHEEGDLREILRANLHDVSVVTHPAYLDTSVAARALEQWRHESDQGTRARRLNLAGMRLRLIEARMR